MSKLKIVNFIYISGIVLALSKTKSRLSTTTTPPPSSPPAATTSTLFSVDISNHIVPSPSTGNSNSDSVIGIHSVTTPAMDEESSSTQQNEHYSSRIPHIIHQSYKSLSTLPSHWADGPAAWQKFHPDYTYKFWSDDDNRRLIQQHFPWFLSTYDNYPAPIQRADAARYFAVLHYGGVYADMDILPIRNVDPLLHILNSRQHADKQMIVAETYNLGLTNALFVSVPNSTILSQYVQELPRHARPLHGFETWVPHFAVLLSTGPTRFWIYLNRYRSNIVTIPPVLWGQCHQCRQRRNHACIPQPGSFFETRQGGSWHRFDTRIMNFIFCHAQFCMWGLVCAVYWLYSKLGSARIISNCCNDGASSEVDGEYFLPQIDRFGMKKRTKWWNPTNDMRGCSVGSMSVRMRVLMAQHRLPLFCGVIFILVF